MRHLWFLTAIILLSACGGATARTPTATGGIGNRVVTGAIALTVNAVTDPLPPLRTQPQAGTRFVAVDLTVENASTTPRYYNVTKAILQTRDDRQYRQAFDVDASPAPPLLYGTMAAGERVRGWVSFEIPQGAQIAAIRYADDTQPAVVVRLP